MTTAARPLVSIIVPVYNVERYLDCCLNSIRAQSYEHLEILVVEDCSTDGSLAALQPHLADYRVQVIRHDRNSGLSAARNTGIEAAKGDFVLFVDSDDAIAPGLIEACVVQAKESDADAVVFDFVPFQDGAELPQIGRSAEEYGSRRLEGVEYFKLPHFAWLKFVRRDLLRNSRLRFPVRYYYEDWPFHWELGFTARVIQMLGGTWYCYRQRTTSITASLGRKLLDQFEVQQMVMDTVLERGGSAEAKVLASKIYGTFWAVLMRVHPDLLPDAIHTAKKLAARLRGSGYDGPAGVRGRLMAFAISLPSSLGLFVLRLFRRVKESVGSYAARAGGIEEASV